MSSFFDSLVADNHDLHMRAVNHPIVQGIGHGTLDDETFRFYLEQDYAFLTRYVRVLARAVDAATDLESAEVLSGLLHATLSVEIEALRKLYASFGGSPTVLDDITPAPTCQAYTDHLLARSADRNLLLILASILPCQWGYGDIGKQLISGNQPSDPRYAAWIEEYASAEYHEAVHRVVGLFDRVASGESESIQRQAREIFRISTHYELRFWDMAERQEQWSTLRDEVVNVS